MEAKCGCAVPDGYPHECDGRRPGPARPLVNSMLPQVRRVWGFDVDKSIDDDKVIRDAREDGASRERIRIRELLAAEYQVWESNPVSPYNHGAMLGLANVLCRIDGLLPRREQNAGE